MSWGKGIEKKEEMSFADEVAAQTGQRVDAPQPEKESAEQKTEKSAKNAAKSKSNNKSKGFTAGKSQKKGKKKK